jgi:hypothetical protein
MMVMQEKLAYLNTSLSSRSPNLSRKHAIALSFGAKNFSTAKSSSNV